MDLGLNGKVALVTAASKGIGRGIAEELAAEGADLAICARGKAALDEAVESLQAKGVRAVGIPADAARAEDVEAVVRATMDDFGRIDVLVNNAGDAWFGRMVETTDEQWGEALDINLYSAVRFTRAVVCPALIQTPLWDRLADAMIGTAGASRDEVFTNLANQFVPLARFGAVDEVAGIVAFLASDRASFITAASINIDGGTTKSII